MIASDKTNVPAKTRARLRINFAVCLFITMWHRLQSVIFLHPAAQTNSLCYFLFHVRDTNHWLMQHCDFG